jgi:hypothetical protein
VGGVVSYGALFSFLGEDVPVFGAVGLGVGTMIGGLLATLYWLPRENGS